MDTMAIPRLYHDGQRYDLILPGVPNMPLLRDLARAAAGPILELACGTGKLTIPLACDGLDVTGLDFSPGMLDEARAKAIAARANVRWVQADMRDFDLGGRFGLIYLVSNALCHLLTLADFEACMACVVRHLAPGGRFLLQVFVPSLEILSHDPKDRYGFSTYKAADGSGTVIVTSSNDYQPNTQISLNRLYTRRSGAAGETSEDLPMRMYFPQELDALLKYNGLGIEGKFGDFDRSPFCSRSAQQVIVCTADGDA